MTLLDYAAEKNRPELIPKERLEAGRALRDQREWEREEEEWERSQWVPPPPDESAQ